MQFRTGSLQEERSEGENVRERERMIECISLQTMHTSCASAVSAKKRSLQEPKKKEKKKRQMKKRKDQEEMNKHFFSITQCCWDANGKGMKALWS